MEDVESPPAHNNGRRGIAFSSSIRDADDGRNIDLYRLMEPQAVGSLQDSKEEKVRQGQLAVP